MTVRLVRPEEVVRHDESVGLKAGEHIKRLKGTAH